MISLIPICVVFLLTARLKCFMCGGGGGCPVNRGGACDCIMSALAIVILFFIFRATGVLDKIFYSLGYTKARPVVHRFVPTPGDITECSRNDTDYPDEITTFNDTDISTTIFLSDIMFNETLSLGLDLTDFDTVNTTEESSTLGSDVSFYDTVQEASYSIDTESTEESMTEYSIPTREGGFMELLRGNKKFMNLPSYVL